MQRKSESMYYELRMYKACPGRLDDIAYRMGNLLPPIFERSGFQKPIGQWTCMAGPMMPLYVWLLRWNDIEQRKAAYAGLQADPEWAKIRVQTNGPRPMLIGFNIYMLMQTTAGEALPSIFPNVKSLEGGIHELRFYEIYPGRDAQALQTMIEVDLPALREAGGITMGVLNMSFGDDMPRLAVFTRWDDFAAREKGLRRYAKTPAVKTARAAEAAELKTYLLGRYDSWLLQHTSFGIPNPYFELGRW